MPPIRLLACVAVGTSLLLSAVVVAARWRQRRSCRLVIRGPSCEEGVYYAEMARIELPSQLRVDLVVDRGDSLEFLLEIEDEQVFLARICVPDTRVYRTLPQVVVRNAMLTCFPSPSESGLRSMRQDVHEAAFHELMQVPRNVSPSLANQFEIPSGVLWLDDPRVVAECFLFDVAHARHDLLCSRSLVVDDVCSRGFEHHGGDWDAFKESIQDHFSIDATPSRGFDELKALLLLHRNTLSSAMLSPTGANKLELVFGVPATEFPFLNCAAESYVFVQQLYSAATETFGRWTYENFVAYMHAVFGHDRAEVVRHVPRIFRTLNRSRNGEISFDELCGWIAKKLSTRSSRHPEQQLLATVMSLRLPFVMFADKRHLWPKLECVLRSLSDDEYHL
jgi:hypothetical protein